MRKVWIDAGHGGKDPGACGNELREKDIVLTLSLEIKKQLERDYEGVQVMLSRSTDVFLELKDRTDAANKAGTDLLVSIHCNAGGGAGGFESFRYTNASAASRSLQNVLHTEIMAALKPFNVIDRGQKAANLHMCRVSKMPAVLTENLFIDVPTDASKLKRQEVIDALITGHVAGIAKYLGIKKKEDKPMSNPNRDINAASPWAVSAWEAATKLGYFDGTRPGSPITREELAIVIMRMENKK
ncbi:N-acetylmuramoyl-L-alanine amidase [Paenibacillus sp. FSL R5-808]|jgi:N-acetylmuramoyl-L-alanine amidase|uniref:N-acetylmuramoyl-L-alanine amidase n=1 Tax=Paenibacillus sp. FSL R5-808 TaxID=1227076 RepID=UPI0003E20332|nr:N-acetylmuramoyl-L-alanine amidase [Paenibacillus sp. FSL R5-808]ETT33258.1 cell wall hydrolase/autolysin [Paenibacillus sp. FSL R5-808]